MKRISERLKESIKPVNAHCDVPCGIYETQTMQLAAASCKQMVEKYQELGEVDDEEPNSMNQAIRIVMMKEEHARLCKEQLYLLWSDYFKPEHLQQFPDLHTVFWDAAKQCGKVKQTMDMAECQKLIDMVHDISHMFEESKK